jgi:hypothetical protein
MEPDLSKAMSMFELTFCAWNSSPPQVIAPPSGAAGAHSPELVQVAPALQPVVRQSGTQRPRESQSCPAAQSACAPQPSPGTHAPTEEHFSPAAQPEASVHFGAQVPLARHTAVEPQLPGPWQLCAQTPAAVQACVEEQSAFEPHPVFVTQPPEAEQR